MEKTCKKHGVLELENIIKENNKSAKSGYTLRCRLCKKEKDKRWNEKNMEYKVEYSKKWRENNPGKRNEWQRNDRKKNPEKYLTYEANQRKKNWRKNSISESLRKLGCSLEQFENLKTNQNNLCAICNKPETRKSRRDGEICRLCIDHCHTTGKIRALLCHSCNTGIGKFKDNIELLECAIEYLKSHKCD